MTDRVTTLPCIHPNPGRGSDWLAIYVMAKHEKRIAEHLGIRQIEHFLPLYDSPRKWRDGSKVTLKLPLFPNYLFARITGRRTPILEIPGVLSIVGHREPTGVSDEYIRFLQQGLKEGRIEPHPWTVGRRVRIKAGALEGFEGVLVRKKAGFRIVLTLDLISRSMAVEVDVQDIESAPDPQKNARAARI